MIDHAIYDKPLLVMSRKNCTVQAQVMMLAVCGFAYCLQTTLYDLNGHVRPREIFGPFNIICMCMDILTNMKSIYFDLNMKI